MILYLIKFTGCLGLLLLVYKVFLEHENMHTFKRFYLLGSLLMAAVLPLITITYYVDPVATDAALNTLVTLDEGNSAETATGLSSTIVWYSLVGIYAIGMLVFALRFGLNIGRIFKTINANPKIKMPHYIQVLLKNSVVPHSFLKYVFVSKNELAQHEISEAVMQHELAHVRQKHSYDILLIELFHIAFWWNPLFIWLKKAVKLNHEFLADQSITSSSMSASQYCDLLFAYASGSDHSALASPINYSLTQKRIVMLTKSFSKKRAVIKALIALPVLAICLLLFNNDLIAQERTYTVVKEIHEGGDHDFKVIHTDHDGTPLHIKIDGKKIMVNGKETKLNRFVSAVNNATKEWEEQQYTSADLHIELGDIDKHFLKKVNDAYKKTKVYKANPNSYGLVPPPPPPPPAPDGNNVIIDIKKNRVIREDVKGNVFVIKDEVDENEEEIEIIEVKEVEGENVWIIEQEVEEESKGGNSYVYRVSPNSELEVIEEFETELPPPPPPPPAPEDPVDLLIDIAKKGGSFFYEGKSVTSDKAIDLVKKNKEMNIMVRMNDNKKPTVKLSKYPIKL
ncbi:MAG: M56 family metallopeptidase [Gilvibacter sp.]